MLAERQGWLVKEDFTEEGLMMGDLGMVTGHPRGQAEGLARFARRAGLADGGLAELSGENLKRLKEAQLGAPNSRSSPHR